MPFEKSALAASVDRLLATSVSLSAAFASGYDYWQSDKKAGIYGIGVTQATKILFETLPQGRT